MKPGSLIKLSLELDKHEIALILSCKNEEYAVFIQGKIHFFSHMYLRNWGTTIEEIPQDNHFSYNVDWKIVY